MGGFHTFTKHLPQKLDSFGNWFQTVSKSKLVQHASLQVSRARAVVWWMFSLDAKSRSMGFPFGFSFHGEPFSNLLDRLNDRTYEVFPSDG